MIVQAIEAGGYQPGKDIAIALDSAASEMWEDGKYVFAKAGTGSKTREEMVNYYQKLSSKYPIISIEDGCAENDWDGWKQLTQRLGLVEDIVMTGGVAKNQGVQDAIEKKLKVRMKRFNGTDPQLVGAWAQR
jgi:enolase